MNYSGLNQDEDALYLLHQFKEYASKNPQCESIIAPVLAQLAFDYDETKTVKVLMDNLVNYDIQSKLDRMNDLK
tara:strand:+ start:87 stop:308 length:222 start_codon:yes stop_codon:yes gene_type:complete